MLPSRTTGVVEFSATLTWRTPEEMPPNEVLASLPCLDSPDLSLEETEDRDSGTRVVSGEISALHEPDLSLILDNILRAVSNAAALTGAILEIRVVRGAADGVGASQVRHEKGAEGTARNLSSSRR